MLREPAPAGEIPRYRRMDRAGDIPDAAGCDERPDPRLIQTRAQLQAALAAYRVWAGEPSYRVLADRCYFRVTATTFYAACNGRELPSLETVREFIGACGFTGGYRLLFEQAWHRVSGR